MIIFLVVMVLVVLAGAVVVGSGRGGEMPELVDDRPVDTLPGGDLAADDVRRASFHLTARGYAPEEVDALLARLADQLERGGQSVTDKAEGHSRGAIAAPEEDLAPEMRNNGSQIGRRDEDAQWLQ